MKKRLFLLPFFGCLAGCAAQGDGAQGAGTSQSAAQGKALSVAPTVTAPVAAPAATPTPAATRKILYVVKGQGRAIINYRDATGKLETNGRSDLPWSLTVEFRGDAAPALYAHGIEADQELTTEIWSDSRVVAEATGNAPKADATCNAAGCATQ